MTSLIAAALRDQEARRDAYGNEREPKRYCFRGHKKDLVRPNGWLDCSECKRIRNREWLRLNRAKKTAYMRLWRRRQK